MRSTTLKSLISLFATLCSVSVLWGQSITWTPKSGTLQQGKANSLELTFDSCQPDGDPVLPDVAGLQFVARGSSTSQMIINGRLSSKVMLTYQVTPSSIGTVTIPGFRVQTSAGELTISAARFEVVEATVGNSGLKPSDVFLSIFQNKNEKIYAGQVFEIEYIAGAKQNYQLADLSVPVWNPTTLVTAGLKDLQVGGVTYEGAQYHVKVYNAKVMAPEAGTIEAPGASQQATVVIGRRSNSLFQDPVYDSFTISSDPFAIEVLPLPEGAPASFGGAVGSFSLESRVVPLAVQVGEPVTWTLEMSGSGNWPAGIGVPPRSVSSRFKAIQPEIKNEFVENDLFLGKQSEDIVLIPTEVGSFEFGPIEYTYFDPETETYQTINIPSQTVTVTPAKPNNPTLSSGSDGETPTVVSGAGPETKETYTLDPTGKNVFLKPPEMVKEPMHGETELSVPQATLPLLKPTLLAIACPIAFWFLLATLTAAKNDPLKPERKALAVLRKVSRTPLPADPEALKRLHLSWRDATARYFALSAVEPTPEEIYEAAFKLRGEEFASNWREAWIISDQALFGTRGCDHEQWQGLVRATSGACPSKRFMPGSIFRFRSWAPCFVFIALFGLGTREVTAQDDKADAFELYDQGQFPGASAKWITAINESPNVVENRYNAGLASAQLGDWGKAWAYWTSAFCLDPSNEDVAWNLRIAHQNTKAYDPVLQSLLEGEDFFALVKLRSPSGWQELSLQSLWALAGLLALSIASLYIRPIRRFASILLIFAVLAGLLSYFSVWSFSKYEALGEPDTLLVVVESPLLSIPTDLQPDQVSSTVSEGTVAKLEKRFLGWMKISLPNGESGWLRREKTMPLYGAITQP